MASKTYNRKPETVSAIQYTGTTQNILEIIDSFTGTEISQYTVYNGSTKSFSISVGMTSEAAVMPDTYDIPLNGYLVRYNDGSIKVMTQDEFNALYEEAAAPEEPETQEGA